VNTLLTVSEAGALAATAAIRLGVPASVWTGATTTDQTAALEAATADLYADPGAQIYGRETDQAVQLACAIQALHLLDIQSDPGAQERRRLQDGGVIGIQQGRVREDYRPGHKAGLCGAARAVLRAYRGAVTLS
jgi:hypothetical protein